MKILKCGWCNLEHLFCDCCGIGIGDKHIAEESIKVGKNLICEVCNMWLLERGQLQLFPYESLEHPCKLWLQRDGSVIKEPVIIGKGLTRFNYVL